MGTSTLRCLVTERAEKFTFVLILIFFSACQPILPKPSVATTTSQTFLTAWETRLDKYREDFVVKDTAIRKKSGDTLQTEIASSPDPWKSLVSSIFELSVMIREAFTTAGRGETLKAFIKHMETHPSLGLSDIWFLQQADDVQSQARIVDEKTKTFFATFDQKVRKNAEWILEIEQLAREQGMLAGKIEELQSLHKQAETYYQDIQQAEAEDRHQAEKRAKAAQALFATAAYLNQQNYQQQLQNSLNRPRTCTFFANMMTCN